MLPDFGFVVSELHAAGFPSSTRVNLCFHHGFLNT